MPSLKLLDRFKSTQIHALSSQDSGSASTSCNSATGSPRFKFKGYSKAHKSSSISVNKTLLPYGLPNSELLEPPIDPCLKPVNVVETLSEIYRRIGSCPESEITMLFVEQYAILCGLGDPKLLRRCLRKARRHAVDLTSKIVLSAWLRFERREDELVGLNSMDCNGFALECPKVALVSGNESNLITPECKCFEFQIDPTNLVNNCVNRKGDSDVTFCVGNEEIECCRSRIAELSIPFEAMLYGGFLESRSAKIDFSQNNVSAEGIRAVESYSRIKSVNSFRVKTVLELLSFANKFCCDELKSACESHLVKFVTSVGEALMFIEYALEENANLLKASCLQVFLRELPRCLYNPKVMRIFCGSNAKERLALPGQSSFLLYYFLSQVAVEENMVPDTTVMLLERMKECASENWQKAIAFHQLGCVLLKRNDLKTSRCYFQSAFESGHVYSLAGVARATHKQGQRYAAYKLINYLLSRYEPKGWMYQERSLYNVGKEKLPDLKIATELDCTLTFPYKYRAVMNLEEKHIKEAVLEMDRIIRFKLAPECLELRAWIYVAAEDVENAVRDIRALLTLEPNYMMFYGNMRGDSMVEFLDRRLEHQSHADCWMKLYDRWSSVDDIGSLAVIHQMLTQDPRKSFLRFRQSLLLLRLNSQKAAMRCLRLARNQTVLDHERLVYEGWILFDTGHNEEALRRAEKSISIQRSFEAFFLKAYVLADRNTDPDSFSGVVLHLQEALKCPSDGLRKGQALNNLGSIYVDCGKLDLAANCYMNALDIKHTRAHQGLARIHFLKNHRQAAYAEMTKLIDKAHNKASAYEKRSEYCEREMVINDLNMATKLDPLRTYPYRYRAAVLMDDQKEAEAVEELAKALAVKPDLQMLHLRAAFYESIGKLDSAIRDSEAALCLEPNHVETLELYNRAKNEAATSSLTVNR